MPQRVRLTARVALKPREVRRRDGHVLRFETDDGVGCRGDIIRRGIRESFQQNGEDLLPVNHGRYLTISSPHMPAA